MVDMGMGEHQNVDFFPLAEALPIEFEGFLPLTLEEAAVKKDFFVVHFEQMLGAGYRSRSSMEGQFHGKFL